MLKGTTPSSLVPSNVVNGTLVRVIECFGTVERPAERAWRMGTRVGGESSGLGVVLLLLRARRNEGTTTSDRRGASQSAATLCSAILSTHSPPRAAEAVISPSSVEAQRGAARSLLLTPHITCTVCHAIVGDAVRAAGQSKLPCLLARTARRTPPRSCRH